MISFRSFIAAAFALSLAACASTAPEATRDASLVPPQSVAAVQSGAGNAPPVIDAKTHYLAAQYDVEAIRIAVPRSLKVSEANSFKPIADIVWRGEPRGDRHQQVAAIFNEAIHSGTSAMQSGRKVDIEIEVTRFHALTEKTRYTIGGVHEMRFVLTVRDTATGQVIDGPREVAADVRASGGSLAIAEDQQGLTQRVVTVQRLSQVIRRELSVTVSQEELVSRLNLPQGIVAPAVTQ